MGLNVFLTLLILHLEVFWVQHVFQMIYCRLRRFNFIVCLQSLTLLSQRLFSTDLDNYGANCGIIFEWDHLFQNGVSTV